MLGVNQVIKNEKDGGILEIKIFLGRGIWRNPWLSQRRNQAKANKACGALSWKPTDKNSPRGEK